ncbi:MAG: hypothetical protein NE328_20840 [Lentisphaeraceae bacterium]|nr:hypothetical protein [Lentisphaeraceae bacterium]
MCAVLWTLTPLWGDEVQDLYRTGKYEESLKKIDSEGGRTFEKIKILKTLGRYEDALKEWLNAGIRSSDIPALYEGIELFRLNGREKDAQHLISRLNFFVNNGYFNDPNELVTRGRTALMKGMDASVILKEFYDEAIRREPTYREAYMAAAELAFSKDDTATAATILQRANRQFAKDPDILLGLSKAFAESEGKFAEEALKSALEINPRHLPTLKYLLHKSLLSDDLIKSEELIKKITSINKNQPEVLAYQACFSLLKNDSKSAETFRSKALAKFSNNPKVDHQIGHFLAYKGRFKDSNKYLESSLKIDISYQPALVDLALNLLRLGDTDKGFQLASEIAEKDPYNLTAFNLLQLYEVFKKMIIVENKHFKVRLNEHDAELYGDHVLEYLMQARKYYNDKYAYQSSEQVFVDFYNDAEDFAIRNFSYPLEFGALGICFGQVITMKTIEAQTNRVHNWRETLWHEYGHVVTLGMTQKNIPRWLTEGISVYEESLGPEGWGMKMTPDFLERLKGKDLYPIEHLNSGFHSQDIMFAYYQAGLQVDFFIQKKGFDTFKKMLYKMAGEEKPLVVIEQFYGKLDALDSEFVDFAVKHVEKAAIKADFAEIDINFEDIKAVENLLKVSSNHYPALSAYSSLLLKAGEEEKAVINLKKMIDLYPEFIEPGNAYERLAEFYRSKKDIKSESDILQKYVHVNANSEMSYERLADMSQNSENWNKTIEYSKRLLGVNPLSAFAYKTLGLANMKTGNEPEAKKYFVKSLKCKEKLYHSEVHYYLAKLLKDKDNKMAKRHVLMCLEEAPRFRDAYKLLLELK